MTANNAINNTLQTPFNVGATSVTATGAQLNYLTSLTNPNIIIGGNFTTNPWQRQTTFTGPTTGSYTADRWKYNFSGSGVNDILKTADSPTASAAGIYSTSCLHADVTTADASIAAGDNYTIQYIVEGYDISPAGFGQSGTRNITLSFWHKHTITGTYCVGFNNSSVDRSYVAEYTQSVADTWELATITLAVDTTGTWLYTNGGGLLLWFTIAAGSTFQTTAGSWQAGLFYATSNQVNGMSSTSNNFKLALVKLEFGAVATPYPIELEADVLKRCQRYYEKTYSQGVYAGAAAGYTGAVTAYPTINDDVQCGHRFAVVKRTAPTMSIYSTGGTVSKVANYQTAADAGTNVAIQNIGTAGYANINSTGTSLAAGTAYVWHWVANADF